MIDGIVKMNGVEMPVSYSMNALAMFQKMTGTPLDKLPEIGMNMPLEWMIIFAYCGLKDGARRAKVEFTATVEDVGDWLTDNAESFTELFTQFVVSQAPAPKDKKKAAAKP